MRKQTPVTKLTLAGALLTGATLGGLLAGTITGSFISLVSLALYQPANAWLCTRCHIKEIPHKQIVSGWQKSSHAGTRCVDCHSRHGIIGYWSESMFTGQITLDALTGGWREHLPVRTQVFDEACLKCHSRRTYIKRSKRWLAAPADTVRFQTQTFTHRTLAQKGYKCTHCHSAVVEGHNIPPGCRTYPHLPPGWPDSSLQATAPTLVLPPPSSPPK